MTTLPKLRVPRETMVRPGTDTLQGCAPPRRSKTMVGLKKTASTRAPQSRDGSSRTAVVFPWIRQDLPGYKPLPIGAQSLRPTRESSFTLSSTDTDFAYDMNILRKKREQYHQFHQNWMRPFYGSKVDQEEYRKGIRTVLKNQMSEKVTDEQKFQKDKVQESVQAVNYDQECITKDMTESRDKALYLREFRDQNKRDIEQRAVRRKETRMNAAVKEQELLRYTPVNWRKTLR